MHPRLRALAAEQGGVFTRRQAIDQGYTERQMKTLTGHAGGWVVVRRGVYAQRQLHSALDETGRHLLAVRAAVLAGTKDVVVSHTSAAVVHNMPSRPRWLELVHLTRPDVRGGRTENGVKHHRPALSERDVVAVQGLAVTGLARTGVDVAREHGLEDGVIACDAARRLGAELSDLSRCLEEGRYHPHNAVARSAVDLSDAGAESIGETLLRLLVLELGIGRPETQYEVSEDGRTARVDLRVGRHLFEFDGRVKYVERDLGGLADRPVNEVVWAEKEREDWLRRANGGYGMSRVVWGELFGAARARTARRLLIEYGDTVRRLGREP